ncbi:hypothetical protein Tco_0433110 [Tanacetum coccineum]
MNGNNQTRGGLNKKLKRGVTFKTKVVLTKGQKSVGKGKQKSVEKGKEKVSEGEALLGMKNRAMEKGKWIMGGSLNVGAKSKSLLYVEERVVDVDNVRGNKTIKTRFVVLGLRARDNLDQQPLALANRDQPTFLTSSISLRKPRSDVKITNCILGIVDQLLVTTSIEGLMLKWCI